MKITHEFRMVGKCPVDDAQDFYEVTVSTDKMIPVERILLAARALEFPDFQESVTAKLAAAIQCTVTTVCYHSGVKTTCTVG